MKLSEKLLVIAEWLDNPENELLEEAEKDEQTLETVAISLVSASNLLKQAVEDLQEIEPKEQEEVPSVIITPEALEEMAAVAASFDASGDELLMKQASVLDEILVGFGAPKNYTFNFKKAEEDKLEALKKRYHYPVDKQHEDIGVKEALEAIKAAPMAKTYRPLSAPLSQRHCVDHPGFMLSRVGDDLWQCQADHKIYSWKNGFETLNGDKVPGGSVEGQSQYVQNNQAEGQMFDSRNSRLGLDHDK